MTHGRERGQRLVAGAASPEMSGLRLDVAEATPPPAGLGCVIETCFAAINPSDVKACLGMMPSAVFPRTPGRDFAGRVIDGPAHFLGMEVWGTGGDIGISRDGSHGRYLWLEQGAVRRKPDSLGMADAAGIGVPFVTAMQGFAEAGGVRPGQVVAVLGANGKVGQAATQIATWHNAEVIAVSRGQVEALDYIGQTVTHVDATRSADLAADILDATIGRGADIVYNTVGSPYWDVGNAILAKGGTHIFISTVELSVPFDIFRFYRGRHRFVGVDSLVLDARESGNHLDYLRPGFETGALKPFPAHPEGPVPLSAWREAYTAVLGGSRYRMIFDLAPTE